MIEWYQALSIAEQCYLVCAVVGGIAFFIELMLVLFGAEVNTDFDISDFAFKFISIQGLSAFGLVGGLVGFYAYDKTGQSILISLACAIFAGVLMAWVLSKFTKSLMSLQSAGNIQLKNAINTFGTIYMSIPKDGIGKVALDLQGRRIYINAISKDGSELDRGIRVKIVDVNGDDALVVSKVESNN